MRFDLTEEQERVRDAARDFARREVAPHAAELDRLARWPAEIVARMGALGLLGAAVPVAHGGAGHDRVSLALAIEEIGAACAGSGAILQAHHLLFCEPLLRHGTAEQHRELLAPAAAGEWLGCSSLSQPPPAEAMTADRQADGSFVLRGRASFVVCGSEAEHAVVLATTSQGPTAFVVRRGSPGFTVSPRHDKIGTRAAHACPLVLEGVRVPAASVLGGEGEGAEVAATTQESGRIGMAALAVGIARAAFEEAASHAREHKAVSSQQSIQFMLSDMAVEIDAARLLVLRAARLVDIGRAGGDPRTPGLRPTAESSMAKLFASEMATRVTHRAIQILGGQGYTTEHGVERHYRDARITEIDEGTSEVQRIVVGAAVLGT